VYAQTYTNWCSLEDDIEIDLMSDRRIEGFKHLAEIRLQEMREKGARAKTIHLHPEINILDEIVGLPVES
jgi:hypothetical protein